LNTLQRLIWMRSAWKAKIRFLTLEGLQVRLSHSDVWAFLGRTAPMTTLARFLARTAPLLAQNAHPYGGWALATLGRLSTPARRL
jgi:hypothetical protein